MLDILNYKIKGFKLSENLLKYIKETPNHPFRDILNISDDNLSIVSSIDNKRRFIYNEKNTALEALGRELFINIDKKMILKKDNFKIEENIKGTSNSIDLIEEKNGKVFSIIEFKEATALTKGNTGRAVNDVFNQIQDYINKKELTQEEDVFGACIIIDVEFLIKNPERADIYYNSINKRDKLSVKESLKNFGIFILTKNYSLTDAEYIKDSEDVSIPISEEFVIEIPNNPIDFCDGRTYFKKSALDAHKIIASSSSLGLSNVRAQLDYIDNQGKRKLVLDIANTLNNGQNTNNFKCLNKESETKTLVLNASRTNVFHTTRIDEKKVKIITIIFVSTDMALINGQQSSESPNIVKEMIEYKGEDSKKLLFRRELLSYLVDINGNFKSSNTELEKFINFIRSCSFNYSVLLEDNPEYINEIAEHKNTSLHVDKEDNYFVKKAPRYIYLSNMVHEKEGIFLNFTNGSSRYTDPTKVMHIKKMIALYSSIVLNGSKKNKKYNVESFINGKKMKFELNDFSEKVMNSIVEYKELKENPKFKKLESDIEILKGQLKGFKDNNETGALSDIIEDTTVNKNRKEDELKELKELSVESYALKDEKITKDIKKIFDLWQLIEEQVSIYEFMKKTQISKNQESIILEFLLKKYKKKLLVTSKEKLQNSISDIINGFIYISENYSFQWTQINNGSIDNLKAITVKHKTKEESINLIDLFELITY